MSIVDYIPGARTLEAMAFAAVVAAVGGVYVKQRHEIVVVTKALTAERADHARDLALAKAAADAGVIANQSETIRRQTAQKEIDNEAQRFEARAHDAAVRAAGADAGLRNAFAAAASAGRGPAAGNTRTVRDGQADAAADLVRADVFGRADEVAGELAQALDIAHARGSSVERKYEALSR